MWTLVIVAMGAPSHLSLQPMGVGSPIPLRTIVTFNEAYSHVLSNFVAHQHHLNASFPTTIHCLDNSSFQLCENLLTGNDYDALECVRTECSTCDEREGISILKFSLLRDAIAAGQPTLYLDGTALQAGRSCLQELEDVDADVVISSELGTGCSPGALLNDTKSREVTANTGVILARATPGALAWLDVLLSDYEDHGFDDAYETCPEQAAFNTHLLARGVREQPTQEGTQPWTFVASTEGADAKIHLLDYARWPRHLTGDEQAYSEWPPIVRERLASVDFRPTGVDLTPPAHQREAPTPDDKTGESVKVCLYHPHVRLAHDDDETEGAGKRGPQAVYFEVDGMWYL